MHPYPRADYETLRRYKPDQTPISVDLSDNRNLWGAHPAAVASLRDSNSDRAARYPDPYGESLGAAVAALLEIDPTQVTTGGGGSGVLDATFRASAPTEMRFLAPGWPAACALARMNGHTPVGIPWTRGLESPESLVGGAGAIVFLANPNNPTGEALPDDWIREVQRRTEANGSLLVLDEAYGEYARGLGDRTPFDLASAGRRTIAVKTLSKAYGLAGLRVGYGVAHPDLIVEVDKARGPFTLSTATGGAGAAAIGSDCDWLERVVSETRENRQRLLTSLDHRGYAPPQSAANFVFIPTEAGRAPDTAARLERLGVRTRPFSDPQPGGTGLRATVGPWEGMERLLDGLDLVRNGTV